MPASISEAKKCIEKPFTYIDHDSVLPELERNINNVDFLKDSSVHHT